MPLSTKKYSNTGVFLRYYAVKVLNNKFGLLHVVDKPYSASQNRAISSIVWIQLYQIVEKILTPFV